MNKNLELLLKNPMQNLNKGRRRVLEKWQTFLQILNC